MGGASGPARGPCRLTPRLALTGAVMCSAFSCDQDVQTPMGQMWEPQAQSIEVDKWRGGHDAKSRREWEQEGRSGKVESRSGLAGSMWEKRRGRHLQKERAYMWVAVAVKLSFYYRNRRHH